MKIWNQWKADFLRDSQKIGVEMISYGRVSICRKARHHFSSEISKQYREIREIWSRTQRPTMSMCWEQLFSDVREKY